MAHSCRAVLPPYISPASYLQPHITAMSNTGPLVSSSPSSLSDTYPPASSSPSKELFDAALTAYEKETKKSLRTHPLMDQLNACSPQPPTPGQILILLLAQVNRITPGDDRIISRLDQIIIVLSVSSPVTRKVVGAVNPIRMILLRSNL